MAVVKINPMNLLGPWGAGYVLDYHSISAAPTGDPYHPFEMKYTELGGRLYRFKYRNDSSVVVDIIDTAMQFIKELGIAIDCVVPAPPSMHRASQPVVELARELAKGLAVPMCEDAVVKGKETPINEKHSRLARATEAIGGGHKGGLGRRKRQVSPTSG
jgi:predicted amidophosphoribosyltransferase